MKTLGVSLVALLCVAATALAQEGAITAEEPVVIDTAACCAVEPGAASSAAGFAPLVGATLHNAASPISGLPATDDYVLELNDVERNVAARIHFASAEELEEAATLDIQDLYAKAYPGPVVALDITFCPVSGVGAIRGEMKVVDKALATNCTAGGCSIGDGFELTYNGMQTKFCCPTCRDTFAKQPEKFLPNIVPLYQQKLLEQATKFDLLDSGTTD